MTTSQNQEIEAKYEILSLRTADRLASAPEISKGFPAGDAAVKTCLDVYYDTAAYDLLRKGLVLRVRQSANDVRVTVKTLGARQESAILHRVELEYQVDPGMGNPPYLKQTSSDLRDLVRERNLRNRKLQPVLTLYQTRIKRIICGTGTLQTNSDQHSALAELSLDRVRVLSAKLAKQSYSDIEKQSPVAEFRELELELLPDADYKQLRLLAGRLARRRGLNKSGTSKLEAGLSALSVASGDDERPNIQPDMQMVEACRLIWRQQSMRIVMLEHGVRTGQDAEYVHNMRVAIRRARTAYKLFGHYFRRRDVEHMFTDLRRLAKLLGRIRDLDVAYENLVTFANDNPQLSNAEIGKMEDETLNQRLIARKKLLRWLDSSKHASLISDFTRLVSSPGAGVKKSHSNVKVSRPTQVRHCMPGAILDRFERVRAYESLIESNPDGSPDQLHSLRIECKHLRYVLEFNRHLLGDMGEELIQQLKVIQDNLGDLNDCAVEHRRLSRLDRGQSFDEIVELRIQDLADTSARLRMEFPALFWQFIAVDNRLLLGEAIANL